MNLNNLTYNPLYLFTYNISLRINISIIFILFAIIYIPKQAHLQDIHLSQYYNSPLNLNPALTAYSQADYRLILNNRNQWASVTVPYKTISGSFDMKLLNRKKSKDYFGIGLIFNKDQAGDSHYGTSQIGINLSWIKSLGRRSHNIIALGIQAAFMQRSIDYTKLYFPEQWNGNISQINTSNSETFTVNTFSFMDYSIGAHHSYAPSNKFKLNSGISVWHISQPKQNLIEGKDAILNIKTQIYTEAYIKTNTPIDLLPAIYLSLQGPYKELLYGIKFNYKIHKGRKRLISLSTAMYIRNIDAAILFAGIDYHKLRLGISYDINTSALKAASQYRGGTEISIKYLIFKNKRAPKLQTTPCPIF